MCYNSFIYSTGNENMHCFQFLTIIFKAVVDKPFGHMFSFLLGECLEVKLHGYLVSTYISLYIYISICIYIYRYVYMYIYI